MSNADLQLAVSGIVQRAIEAGDSAPILGWLIRREALLISAVSLPGSGSLF